MLALWIAYALGIGAIAFMLWALAEFTRERSRNGSSLQVAVRALGIPSPFEFHNRTVFEPRAATKKHAA